MAYYDSKSLLMDLSHYQEWTDMTDMRTVASYHVGWMRANHLDYANQLWTSSSWRGNVQEPFLSWSDGLGKTNLISGAGALLQILIFGYGGLQLKQDKLDWRPQPTNNRTIIVFNEIHYRGSTLNVVFDSSTVSVTLIKQGLYDIYVEDSLLKIYPLRFNLHVVFPCGPFQIYAA
eukprot:TRINITY_DN2618_c0_g1_i13.p1 TRINITY_DN2618_c0_g1~~TRINITY_DN2618_c0_g1_i13.p1  ORF type:complete len:175 (-),score=26.86 TRINITY_DN2618_c0_g1_i13:1543-2067(-)